MTLSQILKPSIEKAVQVLFDIAIDKVEFQTTRKEFEGDITMVIFPLLKVVKSNPVELGNKMIEEEALFSLPNDHPAVIIARQNVNRATQELARAKEQLKITEILSQDEKTTS